MIIVIRTFLRNVHNWLSRMSIHLRNLLPVYLPWVWIRPGNSLMVLLLEGVPDGWIYVLRLSEDVKIRGHFSFPQEWLPTLNLTCHFIGVNQMMTHYCQLVIFIDFMYRFNLFQSQFLYEEPVVFEVRRKLESVCNVMREVLESWVLASI